MAPPHPQNTKRNDKSHGTTSNFEYTKHIQLRHNQFHIKGIGKSSSRKLRRAIYYILYRMDPQKTHYKMSVSAKMSKIKKKNNRIYFPPLNTIDLAVLAVWQCHRQSPQTALQKPTNLEGSKSPLEPPP